MNKQSQSKYKRNEKWADTAESIAALWAELKDGDYIEVRLVLVHNPVWMRRRDADDNESELEFLDAAGDDVSTLATTRVITGATIIGRVDVRLDYTILIHPDGDNDTDIALTPAHIAAIRRSRGQTEVRIGDDGYGDCEYLITIKPDGTGKIGDEVISRKDLLALYNAIGESIEG